MTHTPKGYRIEGGIVEFNRFGKPGKRIASDCERELWAVREELLAALKDFPSIAKAVLKENSTFSMMQALIKILSAAETAIKAAERSE